MSTKKKYPEFEAPTIIIDAIKGYLGPAQMAKLTQTQRRRIAELANDTAGTLGVILEDPEADPAD